MKHDNVVSLQKMIEIIGKTGKHIHVRYDPERETNNWTIIIDSLRLGDTDNPQELLSIYILKQ